MEKFPTQTIEETEDERNLREAQERNQALYDRMLERKGRDEPNPLRDIINECISRAQELPDAQ